MQELSKIVNEDNIKYNPTTKTGHRFVILIIKTCWIVKIEWSDAFNSWLAIFKQLFYISIIED